MKDERTLRDACFDFERQLLSEARPERVVTAVAWRLENLVCILIGHVKLGEVDDELLRGFAIVLRRQELKAEADYTLRHLAWVLAAAGGGAVTQKLRPCLNITRAEVPQPAHAGRARTMSSARRMSATASSPVDRSGASFAKTS
jgi:hypothetical protein